jgi:hypothetical protein
LPSRPPRRARRPRDSARRPARRGRCGTSARTRRGPRGRSDMIGQSAEATVAGTLESSSRRYASAPGRTAARPRQTHSGRRRIV